MSEGTRDRVRSVVADHARLPIEMGTLGDDDDLFVAGMTSHASVSLMLALEDAFDIEFPDEMLTRSVFESVNALAGAIDQLTGSPADA
jgi:acyl carrier protein